jgi:carbamoyltransferase
MSTTVADRVTLDDREKKQLKSLCLRLRDAEYTEDNVRDLLDVTELHQIRDGVSPRMRARANVDTPLGHLTSFWWLRARRSRQVLEQYMGAETVAVLEKLALIEETPEGMKANAHLFPCVGRYIFTDLIGYSGEEMYQVYWLGGDSIGLARTAPRQRIERALDLCTGSGVHAVLAGRHSAESIGVDINPRAIEYSRINAMLNGVDGHTRFILSNLYQEVPVGTFSLITANPPFVPTPRGDLALFRPGGETGEEITSRIVAGVRDRLEVGGTMALVTQCPVMKDSHVLDRMAGWLDGGDGWGLAYLQLGPLDRETMIVGHLKPHDQFVKELGPAEGHEAYRAEYERWSDSYEANGILSVELAVLFIRRLKEGRPGWRAEWRTNLPKVSMSDSVTVWLEAQDRFGADFKMDWEWSPGWGCAERLMIDCKNGEGFVFHPTWCSGGHTLDADDAFVLSKVDGDREAGAIAQLYAERKGLPREDVEAEVTAKLTELGRKLLLC